MVHSIFMTSLGFRSEPQGNCKTHLRSTLNVAAPLYTSFGVLHPWSLWTLQGFPAAPERTSLRSPWCVAKTLFPKNGIFQVQCSCFKENMKKCSSPNLKHTNTQRQGQIQKHVLYSESEPQLVFDAKSLPGGINDTLELSAETLLLFQHHFYAFSAAGRESEANGLSVVRMLRTYTNLWMWFPNAWPPACNPSSVHCSSWA